MGDKKNDMDRVGVFQEMGYVTIGDKYKPPGSEYSVFHYCIFYLKEVNILVFLVIVTPGPSFTNNINLTELLTL